MSEILLNNFSGGLDNVSPISRIKPDASPDCANFMFNRDKSIRKRLGYKAACDTAQSYNIVKIHDFVDRAGTERKIVILADGTVKTLSGTALSAYSLNGETITLPASTQVDMNSTYIGANDTVVATSGGVPRKISSGDNTYERLGDSPTQIYAIEYVSDDEIYCGGMDGYVYKWNGITLSTFGAQFGVGWQITCIKYVSATEIYAGVNGDATHGFYKYDGSSWAELGAVGDRVLSMHYVSANEIYLGLAGALSNCLVKWNGASYDVLDMSLANVFCIHFIASDNIYFTGDSGATYVLYKYDGSSTQICEYGDAFPILSIMFVSASEIYMAGGAGIKKWNGATVTLQYATTSKFAYRVSATEWYQWPSTANYIDKSIDGSTYNPIVNSNMPFTTIEYSRFKYVSNNKIYLGTSIGLVKLSIGITTKLLAANYVISGTVVATSPSKITLTVGSTTNLHAGDFLNHASITEGIYITSKDATAVYTSVNLSAGTYNNIVISQAPKAYYNEIYNNMLFLGNIVYANVNYPAQVAISNNDDKQNFYGDAGILNVLEFGTGEGDGITALKSLNGRLVVFKRYSVFSLSMVDPNEPETIYRQRISDKGCIAYGSVQRIPLPSGITAAMYLNDEGFYLTDATQCWQTPAMKKIWYDWNVSQAAIVTSAWDEDNDLYYIAFPTGSATTNTIVLAYSPFVDAFMPVEFNHSTNTVTAFGIYNRDLYHAETDKKLYIDNQDTGDAAVNAGTGGGAITFQWKTPMLAIDIPQFLKEWRETNIEYRVKAVDGGTPTTTFYIKLYKQGSSSPDTTLTITSTNTTEAQVTSRNRFSLKDKYCTIEITGGTAKDVFELHSIFMKYKTIGVR